MLQKGKQTTQNKYKEKVAILGITEKVGKQGRLPTPADIRTSEHLIPNSVLGIHRIRD